MFGCTFLWYNLITCYLVHVGAWLMHLFMGQVDYKLFGIGWCMVDALVYVDRLISVEYCCLISIGVENVSWVLHIELVLL
jgi:hypothetical protein